MFINIEHRKLRYQWINRDLHTDKKPVIVFLHEGLGSIGQWKDFPELLCKATDLQGLIYEREGYGQSSFWVDAVPEDYLKIEAEEVLPMLLEKLCVKQYYLFGHSDGATLGLYHSAMQPTGLKGLIAEAPHVIIEDITAGALQNVMNPTDPTFISRLDKYHNGRSSKLIDYWTSYWLRPKFENWNMLDVLQKIETRMLLIQGSDDNFGTYLQLEKIQENALADVEQLRLEGCGHIPHLQMPEIVMEASRRFIVG